MLVPLDDPLGTEPPEGHRLPKDPLRPVDSAPPAQVRSSQPLEESGLPLKGFAQDGQMSLVLLDEGHVTTAFEDDQLRVGDSR